jgi:lysophospholipase L1-like esterase
MKQEHKVLVCFGDSNTHGPAPMADLDDMGRFGPDERWTGLLARDLGPQWRLHEEGLPGRTTVHPDPVEGDHLSGLAALPIILGTHTPIDVIVLMLGTNDLKQRFSVGPFDIAAGVDRLIETTRTLCSASGRQARQILVVAPPPIIETGCLADMYEGGQAKSKALGSHLRRVAERRKVAFLDAGEHIQVSHVDGIHFDGDQHGVLAKVIGKALRGSPTREGSAPKRWDRWLLHPATQ